MADSFAADFVVRRAAVQDVADIARLALAAAPALQNYAFRAALMRESVALQKALARPTTMLRVAHSGAGPTATLLAAAHLQRVDVSCEVLDVFVAAAARQKGVATRLLGCCFAELTALGTREVFLEVARGNVAARGLYAKLGFGPCGMRRNYYTAATTPFFAYDVGRAATDALVLRLGLPAPRETVKAPR